MADEAQVRVGLTIRTTGESGQAILDERPSRAFSVDVSNSFGPSPGTIVAENEGTDVSFAQFALLGLTPDLCWIQNLEDADDGNWVDVGRWDPSTAFFYPLMRIYPGEGYVIRLSAGVQQEWTGTGTMDWTTTTTLRIISNKATCSVSVNAYAG